MTSGFIVIAYECKQLFTRIELYCSLKTDKSKRNHRVASLALPLSLTQSMTQTALSDTRESTQDVIKAGSEILSHILKMIM